MKVPFRNKATVGAGLLSASALLLSACGGGGAGAGNAPAEESGDVEVVEESAGEDTANCGEGMTVGVAMPTQTSERWIADGQAVEDGLNAAGFNVDKQFANDDIPTQTQQIDQMITNGVDVLVIASIDGTALSSQLDAAGAAGIPVVSYDRLIRDN